MQRPLLTRLVLALGTPAVLAVTVASIEACGGDDASSASGSSACSRPAPSSAEDNGGVKYCRVGSECGQNVGVPGGVFCTADGSISQGGGDVAAPPLPCANDAACAATNGAAGGTTTAFVCEAGSCRAACASDNACGSHLRCVVATGHCEARPCTPADPPCADENFCTAQGTCAPKRCSPEVPTSCAFGSSCDPTLFACAPRSCTNDTACPDTFRCESGACTRKTCACDTECGATGYCLKGTCAENLGTCQSLGVPGRPLRLDGAPVVARLVVSAAWS